MSVPSTDPPLHEQTVTAGPNAGGRNGSASPAEASAPAASASTARKPGAERVLAVARERGRRGVHASDFDVPGQTVDGGPAIRRLAARVDELRNLGHRFETRTRPDRTVDYVLALDAGDAEDLELAAEPDDVDEPPRLFDPPPAPAREAALQDWEDDVA
jgi:hypothetical protein